MIPEQRLREIAEVDEVAVAISAINGSPSRSPSWNEVRAMAAELLAARAENERLEKQRDELLAAAQKCWRFIRDDFCSASCECYRCYLGRAIKTAEQPKPAGGGA